MIVRCRYSFGALVLSLCSLATHTFAQATSEVPPKDIRVTLLGTASGSTTIRSSPISTRPA